MDVTAKKMKASRMVKVKCVAEESSSLQMDPATSDNSKTIENIALPKPRARPERWRFGFLTRRFFRRLLQRRIRFGVVLQREHQTHDFF